MIKSRIRTAAASAGLLFTMIVASPAWADDVELLLSTPASNAARPNLLFILDSSGSMDDRVQSQAPYNSSTTYSGDCNDNRYYWTTGPDLPDCNNNDYDIRKSYFVCAQGKTQLDASGQYTGTLAMYHSSQWQTLDKTESRKRVECADDSGIHGENDGDAEVYAQAGTNQNRFTADPTRSVDWGAQPTHSIVNVYDGNYLNFLTDDSAQMMRKNDIVKAVMNNVLGSMNKVNVGLMEFNGNNGGEVTYGLKGLDVGTNRADAISEINGLPASGNTPLSEVMYEAARYFRGMDADYGTAAHTDSAALDTTNPLNYKQPVEYACTKNFVVLLTDGLPTADTGTVTKLPMLPGFADANGQATCTGLVANQNPENGVCLDDVARYMANVDLNTVEDGMQNAKTFTIGFDIAAAGQLLQDTAAAGQGKYFPADDVTTLTQAITQITEEVFKRDISFTAPAVAVNAFNRTQNLNDLYISVFRASNKVHWPGNLKKYRIKGAGIEDKDSNDAIDPATGYFSKDANNFWNQGTDDDGADVFLGGTANILPTPASRKLYTNNGSSDLTLPSNALVSTNTNFALADFGLSGTAAEPTLAQIIDWARGVDVADADGDGSTIDQREAMGDTLHSQPASVVYGDSSGGSDVVVYAATNDGYLHAVDADTGIEKWAFVPHELLENFAELYFDNNVNYKNYGLDGDIIPVVYDEDNDGIIESATDFVYLVFGLRRGGDNYYMIEVTDPDKPLFRWSRTFPEVSQSWSPPVVAKIDINSTTHTSPEDAVIVVGGGYDTVHDAPAHPASTDGAGNSIMMLDLETGDRIWRAGPDTPAQLTVAKMTRAIPGRIRVADLNGDGYADRMYAADLGGQIWRFDITNGKTPAQLVTGGVIARLGAEGLATPTIADTRRFYTTPDVSIFTDKRQDRRYVAISLGSGYRAHPLQTSNIDRFYSIRDPDIFNKLTQAQYNSYTIITDAKLTEVAGSYGKVIPPSGGGWMLTLPANEKVLSDSVTFDNTIFFVTMEPRSATIDPCIAGESFNRLYRVDVVNGDPITDIGGDVTLADAARVTSLKQGGIAPKPTFFFPSPTDPDTCTGDECAPPPVGCVGTECFDPGFVNFPVRTLWTQDGIE